MVIAIGADNYAQALDGTAEIYLAAGEIMQQAGLLQGVADEGGYWPAFDGNFAITVLAAAVGVGIVLGFLAFEKAQGKGEAGVSA